MYGGAEEVGEVVSEYKTNDDTDSGGGYMSQLEYWCLYG